MVRPWLRSLLLFSSVASSAFAQPMPSRTGPEPAPAEPTPKPPPRPNLGPEQPIERALRFYAPPNCVSPERVSSAVRDWLGRDTLPTAWAIVIKVRADAAEFSIFEVGRLVALRRFEPLRGGCHDAETVLGASLGLALESLLLRRLEQPPLAFVLPPTVRPAPKRPPPSRPALTVYGMFAYGTLPEPAWGGGVTATIPVKPFTWTELGVLALGAQESSVRLSETKVGFIDSQLVGVRLAQCLNNDGERLVAAGCAILLGGAMSAVGSGDMDPFDGTLPWGAAGLGANLRLRIAGPLALGMGAAATLNFIRPTFRVLDDRGAEVDVRQPSPVGLMVNAGVTWVYR